MIGQNIGLPFLVPLALEQLRENPLAEGNYYAGDLLVNVLRVEPQFWSETPSLRSEVTRIADEAFEIPTITTVEFESIREAYDLFPAVSNQRK